MTYNRKPSLSALFTAARDTTCPICSSSLRVVSSRASGPRIECTAGHEIELRIEDHPAIGTPRFGSAIGTPVYEPNAGALLGNPGDAFTRDTRSGAIPSEGV